MRPGTGPLAILKQRLGKHVYRISYTIGSRENPGLFQGSSNEKAGFLLATC